MRIDHAERRRHLAEAVWRIVLREGMSGASVRGVAREAGLSMGSVRHFFATQDELMRFAMREVIDRTGARIAADESGRAEAVRHGRPVDAALNVLEHFVPLDDARLVEARVWAAFTSLALTTPELAAIRREADDGIRTACRQVLDALAALGRLAPGRDLDVETQRLWALVDGLTLHLLTDPPGVPADQVSTVLRLHLSELQTYQS